MSGLVDNRVAIVTGAARGVGLAVAQTLAMHGARVVVADHGGAADGAPEDPVVTEAATDRCNQLAAGCASAFAEDLASPTGVERLLAHTLDRFGALDLLVCCAAIEPPERDAQAMARTVSNNLTAPTMLASAALAQMQSQTGRVPGAIVHVTGMQGAFGRATQPAASAAQAGLIGLMRAHALAGAPRGITCNAVAALAATRLVQAIEPDDDAARHFRNATLKLPASYVANVIAWLVSPQSAHVTGQFFAVRGREVFLMNQPRSAGAVFQQPGVLDADALSDAIGASLAPAFTPLESDFDAFGTDPVL
jgi:NAD(P)-dependent dehydrogenase (short-subunit alcohol dehydrogenase family)